MDARTWRDAAQGGIAMLLSLPVSMLGLAFFRSWLSLLTHESLMTSLNGPVHDAALAVALLALALLTPRLSPISERRWPVALAATGAVCASALAMAGSSANLGPSPAGIVIACLAACASALFILSWCELYSRLDVTQAALALGVSFMLAVGVNLLLDGMVTSYRRGALVVLPCLSALCFLRARALAPDASRSCSGHLRVPWQLVALIGLYYLASGISMGATDIPSLVYKNASNALAGTLLVGAITLFSSSFDLSRVLRSPAAMFACVLLLCPFAGLGGNSEIVAASTALGAAVFEVCIFLIICDIAHSQAIPAMFLFGIEEATAVCQSAGIALGERSTWLASLGISANVMVITLVALCAILTLLVFGNDRLERAWGVRVFGPGKISQAHEDAERVRTTCALLAESWGLTPRESEVLLLLAAGATLPEVCDALSIARGTAKAHCEHIYTKAGVRSRKELTGKLKLGE